MSVEARNFLARLDGLRVRLYLEDGRLRCQAPKGALTEELKEEMRRHKSDIVAILSREESVENRNRTLHENFERHAASRPGSPAFYFAAGKDGESGALAFGELNRRANQWAHALIEEGVAEGSRIAVCLPPGEDAVTALLATLKIGAVFVPLDPEDPGAYLTARLSQAQPALLLTRRPMAARFQNHELRVIDMGTAPASMAGQENPKRNIQPQAPAWRLQSNGADFTFTHAQLLQSLAFLIAHLSRTDDECVWLHSAIASEIAPAEMLLPLVSGAAFWHGAASAQFPQNCLTFLDSGQLGSWLDEQKETPRKAESPARVVCTGAPLGDRLAARFLEQFPGPLFYAYGRPERGGIIFLQRYERGPENRLKRQDLFSDHGLRVLDGSRNPVPAEMRGEIFVSALAANRNPAAVHQPDLGVPGAAGQEAGALLPTGDWARVRTEGYLEFLGAENRESSRFGYRIGPATVEAVLLQCEEVSACRVMARECPNGDRGWLAYIVPRGPFQDERMQSFEEARLPAHARPESYVPISRLPLTATGRVDESALAQLVVHDANLERRWQRWLGELPGVGRVAAATVESPSEMPRLHLADLGLGSAEEDSGEKAPFPSKSDVKARIPSPEHTGPPSLAVGEPLDLPEDAPRTLDAILERAATRFNHNGAVYLQADGESETRDYAGLLDEARRVLAGLRRLDLEPGDKLLFQLELPRDFLPAFWACVLGGFVPVPVSIPPDYRISSGPLNLLIHARELLENPLILTTAPRETELKAWAETLSRPAVRIAAIDHLRDNQPVQEFHRPAPEDLALMLLTSGSTGRPKAVMQSHGALAYRCAATTQMNGFHPADVSLNWMPLDHVGGLVMFHLRDVYAGAKQIHAPMEAVLGNPLRWLDWIQRFKATVTWAPNFAYGLINDRAAKIERGGWDLSSMRFILNGGEAIVAKTARAFLKLLAPHGLAPTAMYPAWGMSETCSGVTYNRDFSPQNSQDSDPFVFVGRPIPGFSVRIVDERNQLQPEERSGRLQVKGPSVTSGYYRAKELNEEVFTEDGWFDTGDRGLLRRGSLAITGREKDTIIINGINYHGHEIESVAEEIEGVTVSFSAAVAVRSGNADTDQLALFFHTDLEEGLQKAALLHQIRARILETIGVQPSFLLPVSKQTIPKTAIGKIQRSQLVKRFAQGEFTEIQKSVDLLLENANTLPAWFYRPVWRRHEEEPMAAGAPLSPALLFLDQSGLGASLMENLSNAGHPCFGVNQGPGFDEIGPNHFQINPERLEDYHRLFDVLVERGISTLVLLHLWSFGPIAEARRLEPGADFEERQKEGQVLGAFSLLHLVKALERTRVQAGWEDPRLFVVTSRIFRVLPEDKIEVEKATLPPLVKTLAQEHPAFRVRLIDLDPTPGIEKTGFIQREMRLPTALDLVAYRDGRRWSQWLARASLEPDRAQPFSIKKGGLYLITGGLGGIGPHIARHLLENHDAKLLLVGRRPLPPEEDRAGETPGKQEMRLAWGKLRAMARDQDQILYETADLGNFGDLRTRIEKAETQHQTKLDGVFHLAGTYHERALMEEEPEGMWSILRPKLLGALNLKRLVEHRPACGLFLFSSIIGYFGGRNAASYAAANGFLAHLAEDARARGRAVLCLDWGPWQGIGMSRGYFLQELFEARGYRSLSAPQAILSLRLGMRLNQPRLLLGLDESKPFVRGQVDGPTNPLQRLLAFFTSKGEAAKTVQMGPPAPIRDRFGAQSSCHFIEVERLPLTAEGEIDREQLNAMGASAQSSARRRVPPRTETERRLAAIWLDLLPVSELGVEESFFQLGGHSLLATRVVSRILDELGVTIAVRELFQTPTIAGLARKIDALSPDGSAEEDRLGPRKRPSRIPLSFAQQRLWFLNRLEGPHAAYNIPFALGLRGKLDVLAFERTLAAIVDRHESLRTRFGEDEQGPFQIIEQRVRFQVRIVDLSSQAEPERERVVGDLAERESTHVFDLERGPLLRVTLLWRSREHMNPLITMHHIISDGWSAGVFVEELGKIYPHYCGGQGPLPPPLPLQYADFALWQRDRLEILDQQLDYWKRQLEDLPPRLELPTDRRRPAAPSYRAGGERVELDAALTAALERLALDRDATLFMTLLAGFQILLGRYSGSEDFAVGSPIANRTRRELEGLIGFFVNTLVLRADLSEKPTAIALLSRIKETVLAAIAHQETPFERVVEAVQPSRALGHTPLFQVMFVLQNAPGGRLDLPELSLRALEREVTATKFELTLRLTESGGRLSGIMEYKTELFERDTVRALWNQYERLLRAMVENPHLPIARLPLLREAERRALLLQWSRSGETIGEIGNISEYLEGLLSRDQDVSAVIYPRGTTLDGARGIAWFSRNQLGREVHVLASQLNSRGVEPDDRVAILLRRSTENLVTRLAVWRAGAAFVPIDPATPPKRVHAILRDAQVKLLLTDRPAEEAWRLPDHRIMNPNHFRVSPQALHGEKARPLPDPDQLAHLIYTSGSTGEPKGVAVSYRALTHYARAILNRLQPDRGWAWASWSAVSSDASQTGLLGALMGEGSWRIAPEEDAHDPPNAWQTRLPAPEVAHMAPTLLNHFLHAPDPTAFLPGKILVLGGEAADWRMLQRVRELRPDCRIFNHYGPTETTVACVSGEVPTDGEAISAAVPIGGPLSGYRSYLLDRFLEPAPRGAIAELLIGGAGLARGYWNRPEQTAPSFLPDPFHELAGSRMYRTGDLARFLPKGRLAYIGRIDHQIKIRGYRVETQEIEHQIMAHPEVSQAVVVLASGPNDAPRLTAYLTTHPKGKTSQTETKPLELKDLIQFLKPTLPEHMLPGALVRLEAFPITRVGKIDRSALPKPDEPAISTMVSDPPRTATERALAGIWSEILKVPVSERNASFFELGGHSLLATLVISRLRAKLKLDLPVRALFESPTLVELAARAEGAAALPQLPLLPISREKDRTDFPLSFGQRRLWFLERLEGQSAAYNMPLAMKLDGPFDLLALHSALEALKSRHMTLRTTFQDVDGEPMQRISKDHATDAPLVDVTRLPVDIRGNLTDALMEREAGRTFDLGDGPLFRVFLLRPDAGVHIMMLTQHHIISDGWSLAILLRELITHYNGFALPTQNEGRPILPAPAYQYVDYVDWQNRLLRGPELARQLAYWREKLAGAPPLLEMPALRSRPKVQQFEGAAERFHWGKPLADSLAEWSLQEGATSFMTLLAAFQILLSRYSGQADICVGSPIANRTRLELEPLIGFFVNTLVLRTSVAGSETFRGLLRRVKETVLDAFAHQDAPFEKVVEAVQPERSLSHTPLFQAMFAMSNQPIEMIRPLGPIIEPIPMEFQTAKFDLSLTMEESGAGLSGFLQFNRLLFSRGRICDLIENLRTLLEGISTRPDVAVSRLPLLAPEQRKRILAEWNQTQTKPAALPLHAQVWRTAARRPETVALLFHVAGGPDRQLTFETLKTRSLKLARLLRARGIRPERPVGLCLDRSPGVMIAILAILEAGGVYVPLEPGLPRQRLRQMLANTAIELVLADRDQAPLLDSLGVDYLVTEEVPQQEFPASPLEDHYLPDSLAYIIFTSGSSGAPKGVAITHAGIANRLAWSQNFLTLTQADTMLQRTPLGFDASVWELFSPLITGGRLVIAAPDRHGDTGYLIRLIHTRRVSVAQMVPSLFGILLEHEKAALLRGMRVICCGGEAYPRKIYKKLRNLGVDARVVNLYGPTEVTIDATAWSAPEPPGLALLPIGRPIANTRVYILDRWGEPVPAGVSGELQVAGVGLARGYMGRPDLSACKFIPNPFSGNPGGRLYRTGDLARLDGDGLAHYLGRIDFQFKLRGFRIEAGEIETHLERQSGVDQAVVTLTKAPNGERQIVAWLWAGDGDAGEVQALRRSLAKELPDHMMPAQFEWVSRWPRLPNGKVDRAELSRRPPSAWAQSGTASPRKMDPPRELTELRLLEPWCEALGVKEAGIHDNFFESGGHSLLAIRLLARIKGLFGVDLPLATLFESPTVAGLARSIRNYERTETWSHLVVIQRGVDEAGPPLYCLHPPAGTLLCYAPLVRALNIDRPIHGLRASGLEEGQPIIEGIEQMAAAYIETLRERKARSPYHLLGWSAAGLIAFEMARQLKQCGEEVGYLGLIDTGLMAWMPEGPAVDDTAVLLGLWAKDLGISLDSGEDPDRQLARILEFAKSEGLAPPEYGLDQARRRIQVSAAHTRASRAYLPQAYQGPVFLYRATGDKGLVPLGPYLGWERAVPPGERGLARVEVPGDHGSVVDHPNVETLAAAVSEHLRQWG